MPTPLKETTTFDVHDAGIAPLTADPSGGTATYGAWVDVPGISQVGLDPEFVSAEIKGDAKVLARKGKTNAMTFSATYAKLSIEVLKALFGGTVTDTAVTPLSSKWKLTGANSLPYFKLAFAIDEVDLGATTVHVTLFKCQITGGSLFNQQSDQFGERTFQASGIPLASTNDLVEVSMFELATALQV